ncbi:response regulator transcription factor [Paenibacillus methanolicus]|uniref:Two-component system response regulator YesN n=1 Tax=Paenibacillus methanolicus TaxID=582686 RepID=A0A5S5C5Z0_9BACL|nr:response regulator [Paenibacillus methanolicus]TYP74845.1 two-component system response regulator YesN [Paenibacillus methanolicus]
MHNVMIVDDEPLVRLALHRMIDWERLGFRIAAEAADGEDALAKLRKSEPIDLLLLDINMPRMNGIRLLQAIETADGLPSRPAAVVLSAYSEYAYVREAFLLGALDYIVKADMDEAHILPVLTKAKAHLANTRVMQAEPEASLVDTTAMDRREKEARLRKLLMLDEEASAAGHPSSDPAPGARQAEALLPWTVNVKAAVIQLPGGACDEEQAGFLRQTVQSLLAAGEIPHEICEVEPGWWAVLASFPEDRSASVIHAKLTAALSTAQTRLRQYMNASVSVGVSRTAQGGAQWRALYSEARSLAALSYFHGFGNVFYYDTHADRLAARGQADPSPLAMVRGALAQALEAPDAGPLRLAWEEIARLRPSLATWTKEELRQWMTDLLWASSSLLYKRGLRWEALQGGGRHPEEAVHRQDTLDGALNAVRELLLQIHGMLHGGSETEPAKRYSPPVAMAKRLLDEHFREDVNQALASRMAGVSESYLSKQFAKEVGCNFVPYLTNLRIGEAKRLLAQGVKIADASERVGYLNPEHFSRLFKKVTGVSPSAYRDEHERAGVRQS